MSLMLSFSLRPPIGLHDAKKKNQLQCQQGQLQRQQTLISFVIVLLAEESINFSIALDYNGNHVVLHFNGSYSLTHN